MATQRSDKSNKSGNRKRNDASLPREGTFIPDSERRMQTKRRFLYDLTGIGLIAVSFIVLFSLLAPSSAQGGTGGENLFGLLIVDYLRLAVGIGAWIFPFVVFLIGAMLAIGRSRSLDNVGGAVVMYLVIIGWWHLSHSDMKNQFVSEVVKQGGGYIGAGIAFLLRFAFGQIGGHVLFFALTVVGLLWLTDTSLPSVAGMLENSLRVDRIGRHSSSGSDDAREVDGGGDSEIRPHRTRPGFLNFRGTRPKPQPQPQTPSQDDDSGHFDPNKTRKVDFLAASDTVPRANTSRRNAVVRPGDDAPANVPLPPMGNRGGKNGAVNLALNMGGGFALPPMNLLKSPDPKKIGQTGENAERRKVLIQTLEDFGIGANIANVASGPSITRYEIELERGIKVNKIVSLADNLAMAMAASDVRIEAPIPGKSAIGIEIPNESPTMVTLREVIELPEFQNAPSKLTIALGKDVTGIARFADLTKMPHLLIGGTTGSGKSVCLNTIICSLLYRASPREVKFLMIDPKKVELSLYDGIPHLAAPVITNVKQAPSIFKQALREMEGRYDKFSKMGTRNIEGYNSRVAEEEKLAYWVLIVDELADLMMQSGPEIEASICRLAQLARATGIHLIIATQRPSVNVITGTIKANISSRIAFAVNSNVDSRTILDMSGADRLIGRGDMLFMPIDAAKPQRIQGCFVSEKETEDLVNYLKRQAQPNYEVLPSTLATAADEEPEAKSEEGGDDELFESAVKLVVTNGQASTSMLQRRFKVGYTRAARLVDLMEQRGIVGPLDGAKPREILMTRDQVDAMFATSTPGSG